MLDYNPYGYRIKKKGHKDMSEKKGLVKCAIGFVLTILVIVGAMFGLNVDVEVSENTENNPTLEEDFVGPLKQEGHDYSDEANAETTDVVETDESPADSTPTEDEQPSVDESGEADVTQPTDDTENVVTEGEN